MNPEFQKKGLASEFVRLRSRGIEPKDIPPEIVDPLVEKIMSEPDEVLFNISDVFDHEFKGRKGTFEWVTCEKCGEVTFAHEQFSSGSSMAVLIR